MGAMPKLFSSCSCGGFEAGSSNSNPDPNNWELIDIAIFKNSCVLKVKYHGCANFEGMKIMVYEGEKPQMMTLDPHFCESCESPVARFKPDEKGWQRALEFAKSLECST